MASVERSKGRIRKGEEARRIPVTSIGWCWGKYRVDVGGS